MTKINRNDPCFCGSGKKYKKCCLRKKEEQEQKQRVKKQSTTKALDYIAENYPEIILKAVQLLRGRYTEKEFSEIIEKFSEDFIGQLINEFSLIDYEDEGLNATLLEQYLNDKGAELNKDESKYLLALTNTYKSLYEVLEIKKGESILLQDYFSKQKFLVKEKAGTEQMVKWDLIFARLENVDNINYITGVVISFPREADYQLAELKKVYQKNKKIFKKKKLPKEDQLFIFRHSITPLIFLNIIDYYTNFKRTLVNKEGDLFEFCRAESKVTNYEETKKYLDKNFELVSEEPKELVYNLLDRVNSIIASFYLKKEKLVVEVNSKKRLEKIKKEHLKNLFYCTKDWQSEIKDVDETLEEYRDKKPLGAEEKNEIPEEIKKEVAKEFFEDYYKKWFNMPIPLLGNLTPREASKKKSAKPKLIELLKLIENRREKGAKNDQDLNSARIDIEMIKKELGIEY